MRIALIAAVLVVAMASLSTAQQPKKRKAVQPKKSISVQQIGSSLHPTYDMGPGSVGRFFYPQTVGSYWRLRIVERYLDQNNVVISSDSLNSVERVISNSVKSFQGLPLVFCESRSWRGADTAHAHTVTDAYYVDDSLIMTVVNNSISNAENHVLLVAPIRIGGHWLEKTGDSARCEIVSMHDTASTPYGNFGNALVTVSKLGKIEMAKYFVEGVGLVKTVLRAPGSKPGETNVVTSELMELVRGADAPASDTLGTKPN